MNNDTDKEDLLGALFPRMGGGGGGGGRAPCTLQQ